MQFFSTFFLLIWYLQTFILNLFYSKYFPKNLFYLINHDFYFIPKAFSVFQIVCFMHVLFFSLFHDLHRIIWHCSELFFIAVQILFFSPFCWWNLFSQLRWNQMVIFIIFFPLIPFLISLEMVTDLLHSLIVLLRLIFFVPGQRFFSEFLEVSLFLGFLVQNVAIL